MLLLRMGVLLLFIIIIIILLLFFIIIIIIIINDALTFFSYGYMALDICLKSTTRGTEETCWCHFMDYSFLAKDTLTYRIVYTVAFVTLAVEHWLKWMLYH